MNPIKKKRYQTAFTSENPKCAVQYSHLIKDLASQDNTIVFWHNVNSSDFKARVIFEGMRRQGTLICEMVDCQEPLVVTKSNGKRNLRMATIEHVDPVSNAPHLKYSLFNTIVTCSDCNRKRGTMPIYKAGKFWYYDNKQLAPKKEIVLGNEIDNKLLKKIQSTRNSASKNTYRQKNIVELLTELEALVIQKSETELLVDGLNKQLSATLKAYRYMKDCYEKLYDHNLECKKTLKQRKDMLNKYQAKVKSLLHKQLNIFMMDTELAKINTNSNKVLAELDKFHNQTRGMVNEFKRNPQLENIR